MYREIIYMLACLNILVIVSTTSSGESSRSNEIEQEYLEELYDEDIVRLLNSMPTLDQMAVVFDDNDILHLTKECYTNEDCLNVKKTSVKKYQQKLQAIQCVNGLFVLNVLDELKAIMRQQTIVALENELNPAYLIYKFYLKRMLSVLQLANWDPYAWQIEIFTFVSGLVSYDTDFQKYKDHFLVHNLRLRTDVLAFVGQCVQHKYLKHLGATAPEKLTISCFVDNIYTAMDFLYKNHTLDIYVLIERHLVPNLMLLQIHIHHKFIFDWSQFSIELKTTNIESRLAGYVALYPSQQLSRQWQLDPIRGNKYNALIVDCIRLRCMYHTWFHLYTYLSVLRRPIPNNIIIVLRRMEVLRLWYYLVVPLKDTLRKFRFKENIYWSALRDMMADIDTISTDQLAAREQFTRNHFCQSVENLGLARAPNVDGQLKAIPVSELYTVIYRRIKANAEMFDKYISDTTIALSPFYAVNIRVVVSAETNETFVLR